MIPPPKLTDPNLKVEKIVLTDTEKQLSAIAVERALDLVEGLSASEETFVVSPFSAQSALGISMHLTSDEDAQGIIDSFYGSHYTATDIDGLLDKLITQLPAISSATLSPVSLVLMDNDANLPNIDKESIISTYKAPVATTDFTSGAAEGVINEWVSQYTDGNVKSLVSSVLPAPSKQCITAHTAHLSAYLGHGSYYLEQAFTSPDGKSELKKMVAIYSNTSWLEDEGKLIVPITVSGSIKLVLIMPKGNIATGKDWLRNTWKEAATLLDRKDTDWAKVILPTFTAKTDIELSTTQTKWEFAPEIDEIHLTSDFTINANGISYVPESDDAPSALPPISDEDFESLTSLTIDNPFYFFIYEQTSNTIITAGAYKGK